MPQLHYSEDEYRDPRRIVRVLGSVIEEIEQAYSGLSKLSRRNSKEFEDCYEYVPLDNGIFYDFMLDLKRYHHSIEGKNSVEHSSCLDFLEVGCGIGTKMILAKHVLGSSNGHTYGIEIDSTLAKIAHLLTNVDIFEEDALTFSDYGKYDIIYYFCPFKNSEKEQELELLIEDKLKVGAYIVHVLKRDHACEKDGRFKRIAGNDVNGVLVKLEA